MAAATPAALVLSKLEEFYTVQANYDILDLLLDKQRGRAQDMPSLRVLEHLVTNFSRQKGFKFQLPHQDVPMHLYDAYQAELQRHGKVLFDVFAREDRYSTSKHVLASPNKDGRSLKTTAKQMNFVRWAILNNVIDYAQQHLSQIREHLPKHFREAKAQQDIGSKKRQRTTYSRPSMLHRGDFRLSFTLPSAEQHVQESGPKDQPLCRGLEPPPQ